MHEVGIAEMLSEIAIEEAKRHNFSKVSSLKVQIGEMAAVVPEALIFAFSIVSKGTILEGAQLSIEIVPIVARCDRCEELFEVENFSFKCPECGKVSDHCISGKELLLISIEGEKGEHPHV
ncbi:MAG: hydrogenase maturation nickel metallochaperone HypA [Syntrophobacterales bacterium]|nr:hydrogenase maturation nickel metallochaperone HypA [Syntrophobacterales bacterium]